MNVKNRLWPGIGEKLKELKERRKRDKGRSDDLDLTKLFKAGVCKGFHDEEHESCQICRINSECAKIKKKNLKNLLHDKDK